MQLSKDEWRAVSERAAAAKYGERHAAWLRFRRFGLGPAGILLAVGAAGLAAWWLFTSVAGLFSGRGITEHLPLAWWIVATLASIGTLAAYRVRIPSAGFLIGRTLVAGFVWLGLLTYAVTVLAT